MLSNASKLQVLEQFYALDYVLFGEKVTNLNSCCPILVESYIDVKGALMSVIIELYKLTQHSPKSKVKSLNESQIFSKARKMARTSREMGVALVKSKKGKQVVSAIVKEQLTAKKTKKIKKSLMEKVSLRVTKQQAHKLAIDNLLIARTLYESKNIKKKANTFEFKILRDSYEILRDSLLEQAFEILKGIE